MTYVVTQAFCTMLLLCSHARSYLISDADGHGRVFDGIGAVSGGSVSIMLLKAHMVAVKITLQLRVFMPRVKCGCVEVRMCDL